jgi:hypothetical protein
MAHQTHSYVMCCCCYATVPLRALQSPSPHFLFKVAGWRLAIWLDKGTTYSWGGGGPVIDGK